MEQITSQFSPLPVRPRDRTWGPIAFGCVAFSVVVATWSFLIGAVVAEFASATVAIGAAMFGYLAPFVLVAFSLLMCQKYGLDPYTAAQPIFGVRGSAIIIVLALIVVEGWGALIAVMFGQAIVNVYGGLAGIAAEDVNRAVFVGANVVFILIVWLILWKGPVAVKYINLLIAPALLLILLGMFSLILTRQPWSEFVNIPATNPLGNHRRNSMVALEVVFGVTWSWWPVAGIWMRFARSPRVAFHGTVWGSGLGFAVGTLLATFSALAVGTHDPTKWVVEIGGVSLGVLALLFVAIANIMSDVGQFYPVSIGVQFWRVLRRLRWPVLAALLLAPVVSVLGFDPDTVFGLTGSLIILCGVFFAPACAIYVTDFWFLRRGQIHVPELFKRNGSYHFYGGFNPAAFIALVIGFIVYIVLLNPVTIESQMWSVFEWGTATVPTVLVTGITYYTLAKWWIIPSGRGGYEPRGTATSATASSHRP